MKSAKIKSKAKKKITSSVSISLKNVKSKRVVNHSKVTKKQANQIDKALKIPTVGFVRKISNDSIRHAYNQHKNDVVPLLPSDFKLIPEILFAPDKVRNGGKSNSVVYEKLIRKKYFVVEVKRKNKSILDLKTMYVK